MRVEPGPDGAAWTLFAERDPALMPLAALLPRVGAALARHQQRVAAAHGVTPTALGVLGVLVRDDRLSHRELAGRLGVTPATLTAVVDALEAADEVRRTRDRDDRRIVRLGITGAGRERWAAVSGEVARALPGVPGVAPEDEATVRRYLVAVLAAVAAD